MIKKLYALALEKCAVESADNPMNQELLLGGHFYLMVLKVSTYQLLREASHIDFVHKKCHMDVLLETPPPPPHALFLTLSRLLRYYYRAGFKIECCYKSIKVHLPVREETSSSLNSYLILVWLMNFHNTLVVKIK